MNPDLFGFPTRNLEDLCEIQIGKTPSRKESRYWGGNNTWVTISDLNGQPIIRESREMITDEAVAECGCKLIPPNTLLMSFKLSIGKVALTGKPLFTNEAIAALPIRDTNALDSRYLYHALKVINYDVDTDRAAKGKTLNKPKLKALKIPLPPLPEQKRIAAILDKADAIRRKRAQALQLTDQFLPSVFLDMFGDPVTNPKGWPLITGDDAFSMLQYGTSTKCHEVPGTGDLPVLRIPNVARGEVNFEDLKYATLSSGEVESLLLKQDDILLVRSNGNPDYIARCALWQGTGEYLFASYLIRGRLSETSGLRPLFLKELLSFPTYRSKLVRETQTTAGNYNISGSGLRRLVFMVPPCSLQDKFIKQVTQSKLIAQKMAAQKLVTEQQFNGLSTRAFRGEL